MSLTHIRTALIFSKRDGHNICLQTHLSRLKIFVGNLCSGGYISGYKNKIILKITLNFVSIFGMYNSLAVSVPIIMIIFHG